MNARSIHTLRPAFALAAALSVAACAASNNRPAPHVVPRPLEAGPADSPAANRVEDAAEEGAAGDPRTASKALGLAPGQAGGQAGGAAGGAAAAKPVRGGNPPLPSGTLGLGAETLIATVSGTRIELGDLLGSWLRRDGAAVRALLDDLVLSRIVELESARIGAELPAGLLARTFEKRREALAAEAARAGAASLDAFLRARLGLEPAQFFIGLERELAVDLMAARAVRGWLLTSERAEVRVIAAGTPEKRDQVAAALADGRAFSDVARELSEDPSKEEGGRMTPVVRGDSTLAELAFATPVGEVAGPVEERGKFLFILVDGRPRPLAGPWTTLGPEVEASLARRSIEDPEYWQWQQAMQVIYEVDLEPFRALLGSRP